MEEKMITQKGLIQIPLLIAIIVGILVLSGAGYVGVKQYQNNQAKIIEQERVAQEKEKESQIATEAQQKALEVAQQEIQKLKEQSTKSEENQQQLAQKVLNQQKQNLSISVSELAPYLTGVVRIDCSDWWGSGSLWDWGDLGFSVLTNYHVFQDAKQCAVLTEEKDNRYVNAATIKSSNKKLLDAKKDIAIIQLSPIVVEGEQSMPFDKFNYSIGAMKICAENMPIGSPVVTIGFPAFAVKEISYKQYLTNSYSQITSNGIISGYDEAINNTNWGTLPFQNYYVSAKIDSGNSGGIAISKSSVGGLCILGIPTWVSIGNYETQGLVQNIHNVMYKMYK